MALLLIYSQLIQNKRSCLKSQQPCQYCDLAQYDRVVYIYVSHFDKLNVTIKAYYFLNMVFNTASFTFTGYFFFKEALHSFSRYSW